MGALNYGRNEFYVMMSNICFKFFDLVHHVIYVCSSGIVGAALVGTTRPCPLRHQLESLSWDWKIWSQCGILNGYLLVAPLEMPARPCDSPPCCRAQARLGFVATGFWKAGKSSRANAYQSWLAASPVGQSKITWSNPGSIWRPLKGLNTEGQPGPLEPAVLTYHGRVTGESHTNTSCPAFGGSRRRNLLNTGNVTAHPSA